ncbi:MAG: hypothetical protein KatS3mg111_1906 [Pirellulaceae bacterium]|nr:MAG: hypothetical protein KatS3mg111_1906 [Pirellulaceae bacterium]
MLQYCRSNPQLLLPILRHRLTVARCTAGIQKEISPTVVARPTNARLDHCHADGKRCPHLQREPAEQQEEKLRGGAIAAAPPPNRVKPPSDTPLAYRSAVPQTPLQGLQQLSQLISFHCQQLVARYGCVSHQFHQHLYLTD